jgi:hypothetical protein
MRAYRIWKHGQAAIYWVAQLKTGKPGECDWGYTTNAANAIELSPYWQRRFRSDTAAVGYEAKFI